MIYINNNIDNTIKTDFILDYIPTGVTINFDDIKIGDYTPNSGSTTNVIIIDIPKLDLDNAKLQNNDYILKIYDNTELVKIDKITILSSSIKPSTIQYNNKIDYIQYNE